MKVGITHKKYLFILFSIFAIEWVYLAINPLYPKDWLLENILVVVAVIFLFATFKKLPLSRISYTLIFVFLALHVVGSHYTYAEVPYDEWFLSLTGTTINEIFGWQRNHFDRLVHFCYGLLLAYPIREMFLRVANVKGFWGYFLPLDLTMSSSMFYELVEWVVATIVGGDLGMAYLGTQGDIWDAHKDMALASFGALIAMLIVVSINRVIQRDFAREWVGSLQVKHKKPLGEDELVRMLDD